MATIPLESCLDTSDPEDNGQMLEETRLEEKGAEVSSNNTKPDAFPITTQYL